MLQTADAVAQNPWKLCLLCGQKRIFASAIEFRSHLRMAHCVKEGGSFICKYGRNNVCPSLPVEGVHEKDYANHVEKVHIFLNGRAKNIQLKVPEHSSPPLSPVTKRERRSNLAITYKDDNLTGSDKTSWTQHPCQNLSSVLNDPRRSTRESDFFTRIWGESFVPQGVVPLTLLPNTPRGYFADYWKRYEIKYMQHERLKKANLAPHTGKQSKSSIDKKLADISDSETNSIPEVFLQQEFNLENPALFNVVLPWSHIQPKSSNRKNSGRLLQEKLGHYLDITEVKLAQQIATKSEDFFGAMRSQKKLECEVQSSCQEVHQLRQRLIEMRNRLVQEPLNVMRLFRLRHRYETVEDKLNLMATIHQTQPTIQLLLSNSDFISALDVIETSLEVLKQELAGVQCFRHLGSQLTEMRRVIEKMMTADFLDFALAILNHPHSDDVNAMYQEDRLLSVVLGLLHQRQLNFLHLYKTEAFSVLKSTIKQTAHDAVAEDAEQSEEQSAKFGDYIRSLDHNEWLMVLEAVFCVVLQILRNMKVVHEGLSRVFTLAAGIGKEKKNGSDDEYLLVEDNVNIFMEQSECDKLTNESKDILCSACELAQTRCSKVIIMRAKGGLLDKLSSKDFVVLARIVEKFASDCETVSGRQSHNLRGTLLSQAKNFISRFHEERKHKLSNILDIERWRQADVPTEIQNLVDSIASGLEKASTRKVYAEENTSASSLIVQGQRFAVVGTLLILMKMVVEYCQCVDDVPMLATDLLTKLCEILKLFNSRSCQLVLGAGALQTIGLKTITAKHLILVAQCLEVVIRHIHIIKNHFEVRIALRQFVLLSQFDQILKDYSNHRYEILNKIVNLMEGVFRSHLENYELRPPMPSKVMRAVVKQIIKLRESLTLILDGQQLENLFRDIRRCFKNCYAETLAELKVKNDGGPQHGLVTSDCVFYLSSLKQYSGFTDLTHNFDDLWNSVKEKRTNFHLQEQKHKSTNKQTYTKQSKYP